MAKKTGMAGYGVVLEEVEEVFAFFGCFFKAVEKSLVEGGAL